MRRRSALLPVLLAAVCVLATAAIPAQAQGRGPSARVTGHPSHRPWVMPFGAARQSSAPAGAHLTYYGGRVISNVQVVQVIYGSGTYLPQTTSTGSPSVKSFYAGVTQSPYFDWLTEYNTTTQAGTRTNQTIGRGSYGGLVTITPSAANNGATIQDSNIQAELAAQIDAGTLPAPTSDAAGNRNTIYSVFFRHGQSICMGGSCSLVAGGFCAYHGTFVHNGADIYYAVEPDLAGVAGCGTSTDFNNTTSVASHELIEAVTDAEVGLATTNAPPLAWYDNTNGEIGDICNGQQGTVVGGDGVTYTVQKEFSNAANDCIVQRTVTNDFSVAVSPSSQTLAAGASTTYTVSTAVTSGSAQTVSLGVTGLPSGVTATLSPTSVSAGQSSTLTVTAAASAPAASATLTVTGTAASGSHAATAGLTVTSTSPPPGGLTNGGFETGSLAPWTASGASDTVVTTTPHSGTYADRGGLTTPTNGDSTATQSFTAPAGSTGLSFWYKMTCPDTVTYDWSLATLKDTTTGVSTTPLAKGCRTNSWTQVTAALTAGHSYTLSLTSHDDNYASDPSYTLFDDVAITSTPPPPSGVTNGGFETGALSPWTATGAAEAVISTGAHSGTYTDRGGLTTPTNGDSTITQSFTAPTGSSRVSFWYRMTCPDTVTYDWSTATLKDVTAGTTAVVLPKACTTNAWTQVTAAITAGHSYTLSLTSHDDNYASDPSYTLYDDVTTQ